MPQQTHLSQGLPVTFLLLPQRQPSKFSTPEYTVELRGASLSWAPKDKSSKKNVLEGTYPVFLASQILQFPLQELS
ncbi:hypothetical protein P7K49_010711 [Saguinus oedipus]|uniref:Uncharacterized protein n=1 Tax=Saguinus oedipus TaxID=9490 RepID=A0ABQ9VP67_SAGOE|nr:hypothetical protein P7K49_010711 [Saguinus oedipus]